MTNWYTNNNSIAPQDDEQIDGGGDHFLTGEDQQEMDAAITYHGSDENYGYRLVSKQENSNLAVWVDRCVLATNMLQCWLYQTLRA